MELTVTQENLSRALTATGRVASSRTQLPILNNILLKTDNKRLLIAATDLEIAETHHIGAKITKNGSITIPAKLAADFVSNLPKDTVSLKVENNKLHIKSGSYSSTINGIEADEFPELPTINDDSSLRYTILSDDFKKAVNQTSIAASSDTMRPVFTGVFWHSRNGFLFLVATDGYRLAERRLMKANSDINAIIPTQTLQESLRVLTDDISKVEVLFDDEQVRFRIGEVEIISRLIDAKFPDYHQLIPENVSSKATLKKEDFVRLTKVAGLFARESGGGVTLTLDSDKKSISIHSIASELGENTSESTAEVTEDGVITLNARYISDALTVLDGEMIEFGFNNKLSASVLQVKEKDPSYIHIIMPLKS